MIQELSAAGRHQECLQACQSALQVNPYETYAYKYAGKSLLALRQFEKAQQCLVKAHQLDSSDPEIVKDIGNIFLNLGSQDMALEWYEKALEINNNYASAINNLASLKNQGGKHQEAIDLFKRAIQADPELIQAYVGAASSFLRLGDLYQAELFATQALAINQATPRINEILGIISQNKSNPAQAIECYQKELEVNPQASNSLLNLGLLLLQKGQAALAVESLSKASALAPSQQCSLLLAQAYQNLGQFKEAIVEYKKLDIDQAKNKMIPFNLGLCLLEIVDNNAAIEAFKTAVQLDESFVAAWVNLGTALKAESRLNEAVQVTQKVIDMEPNNPDALMNLGLIYADLCSFDLALAFTTRAIEIAPDNANYFSNISGIYKLKQDLPQAHSYALRSLELQPNNHYFLRNLGSICRDLGNLDEALSATIKSIEFEPNDSQSYKMLGIIYSDLGNLNKALLATSKSLELSPNNPSVLSQLGYIYLKIGDFKNSEKFTKQAVDLDSTDSLFYKNLSLAYLAQSRINLSRESIDCALRIDPLSKQNRIISFLVNARQASSFFKQSPTLKCLTTNSRMLRTFPIILNRDVEPELFDAICNLNHTRYGLITTDPTIGNSRGSGNNYSFFGDNKKIAKSLEDDLISILNAEFKSDVFFCESFYTIMCVDGTVKKHHHLNEIDKIQALGFGDLKYSLVYYVAIGSQDSSHPGILKFYDPEKQIVPREGMIVVFPSDRYHSVKYNGKKDRVMISVNFYISQDN